MHPDPGKAWSDGEQSLDFGGFDAMMSGLEPWIALREKALQDEELEQRELAGLSPAEAVR